MCLLVVIGGSSLAVAQAPIQPGQRPFPARLPVDSFDALLPRLPAGSIVSVLLADGSTVLGTVTNVSPSALVLELVGGPREIPSREVRRVELQRARNRRGLGFLIGGLFGAGIGASDCGKQSNSYYGSGGSCAAAALGGGLVLGLIGAAVGKAMWRSQILYASPVHVAQEPPLAITREEPVAAPFSPSTAPAAPSTVEPRQPQEAPASAPSPERTSLRSLAGLTDRVGSGEIIIVQRSNAVEVRGKFISLSDEALMLERGRELRDRIPVSEVVQVWRRKGSGAGAGAGYGAIVGALMFGGIGAAAETTAEYSTKDNVVLGALFGAMMGSLIGGLVGSASDARELVFQGPPVVQSTPRPWLTAWRSPD
jgi:hypothetical protein